MFLPISKNSKFDPEWENSKDEVKVFLSDSRRGCLDGMENNKCRTLGFSDS